MSLALIPTLVVSDSEFCSGPATFPKTGDADETRQERDGESFGSSVLRVVGRSISVDFGHSRLRMRATAVIICARFFGALMDYQTYHHNRNYGCRITEFVLKGHRAVTLENESLRVTVLADKGTDIYEFLYKPLDVDFMWRSWLGLRDRAHYLPTTARRDGAHADYYEGGWQELFPNCGAISVHQEAEIGQHGEVLLLPWQYAITRDEPDNIEVRFEVRTVRTPFRLVKTLSLSGKHPVLRIQERVTNESGQEVAFTWGHHPALGWPFLDESCRVDVPESRIVTLPEYTPPASRLSDQQSRAWPLADGRDGSVVDLPLIPGREVGGSDMVFLRDLKEGWFAVTNTQRRVGFAMRYPAAIFKYLWYWQVYRGGRNYPWWGATYNIALEPCAS